MVKAAKSNGWFDYMLIAVSALAILAILSLAFQGETAKKSLFSGLDHEICGNACMTHCVSYHHDLCAALEKYYLNNKDLQSYNISETCDNLCLILNSDACTTSCNGTEVRTVVQDLNCSAHSPYC